MLNENSETYHSWNKTDNNYLFIDSIENPIDSLETGLFFLEKRNDNLKWKWIILSIHHSLYLFCIANLEGGNFLRVLSNSNDDNNTYFSRGNNIWKKSKKKTRGNHGGYLIEWDSVNVSEIKKINSELKVPSERKQKLIGFWTALARVQDNEFYMNKLTISKAFKISDAEWESVEKLNYYRNEFTHYIPSGYAISILELQKICSDIVGLIKSLALETNQVMYIDEGSRERVERVIQNYQSILK